MIVMAGCRLDGSYRARVDGVDACQMCCISTFSERTVVDVNSAVKVRPDIPLEKACLVGCGVSTGWGSAVYSAEVRAGQTVIVMGVGGVGIHAVQGAAHSGASHVIAVDPVSFKTEVAERLGATISFDNIAAATEFAQSVTNGQGADAVIVTTGVLLTEHVSEALAATRKGGTLVITSVGNSQTAMIQVPAWEVTIYQRRIQGSLFGASSPNRDIPWILDMYQTGQLHLDEVVTTTYSLDQINEGYADMHAGRNVRGVIVY
jgi:S-(hydroxymethyl)glutathione dehydrogenase/alcohol dehydrogenase